MKTTATRTVFVNEIDAEPRRSLEQLVGQPLANDEKVRIIVTKPRVAPNAAAKSAAIADLQRVFANSDSRNASDDDVAEAVDEAIEAIRYGRDA